MKKNKASDPLKDEIERGLKDLLSGKSTKTAEEKHELRANLKLAMQFRAIEAKIGDQEYGTGFSNGSDESNADEPSDD